ncbi:lipopolysaccharide kinase InaA family protein [Flexistipes sp.]|uniref:lipopolysaccharide kinase InaA family protein n=1 Tax=Flexistipes sp. TaxID=3088135 RepID=UPI002E202E4E|nr:lipopolysaccharide kinase InaA family protein [Flexistipes sp.]
MKIIKSNKSIGNNFYKIFYCNNVYQYKKPVMEYLFSKILYKKSVSGIPAKTLKFYFKRKKAVVVMHRIADFTPLGSFLINMKYEKKIEYIEEAFIKVAKMHSLGVRHGDLGLRQFVVIDNNVWLFDFESSQFKFFRYMAAREVYDLFKNTKKLIGYKSTNKIFRKYIQNLKANNYTKNKIEKYVYKRLEKD